MPDRKGTNWPDLRSYRCNSPRDLAPMAKIFLPSKLGTGDQESIGPVVSCTGSWLAFCKSASLSRIAHRFVVVPLRVDWKTKYFPSEVHFPQHSAGGLFQPGRRG